LLDCPLDLSDERALLGEHRPLLGGKHLVRETLESVASNGAVLLGAQDEAHGWVLAREHPVLAGVVQVEVHLASVRVGEPIQLEVDDEEASQATMEEQQVDSIPSVPDAQLTLPTHEGEVAAEFQ
jgi:hypothetical protein